MPNNKPLPPEIQEIREVVAQAFSDDRKAQEAFYDDQPGDYPSCNQRAAQLLSELSKPPYNVVRLAEDQNLPRVPEREWPQLLKIRYGQKGMLYAGFRRVENLDGTEVKEG